MITPEQSLNLLRERNRLTEENEHLASDNARLREALASIEENLMGLSNTRFIWCEHPDGEEAKARFAAAIRTNAGIAFAALAGREGEK